MSNHFKKRDYLAVALIIAFMIVFCYLVALVLPTVSP